RWRRSTAGRLSCLSIGGSADLVAQVGYAAPTGEAADQEVEGEHRGGRADKRQKASEDSGERSDWVGRRIGTADAADHGNTEPRQSEAAADDEHQKHDPLGVGVQLKIAAGKCEWKERRHRV